MSNSTISDYGNMTVRYIILDRYSDGSYIGSYKGYKEFSLPENAPV